MLSLTVGGAISQGAPAASGGGFSPGASKGKQALWTDTLVVAHLGLFWIYDLQNCEINISLFNLLNLWSFVTAEVADEYRRVSRSEELG